MPRYDLTKADQYDFPEPPLWTVAELIEALQQCPPDYLIEIHMGDLPSSGLVTVGIDPDCETVDLFAE